MKGSTKIKSVSKILKFWTPCYFKDPQLGLVIDPFVVKIWSFPILTWEGWKWKNFKLTWIEFCHLLCGVGIFGSAHSRVYCWNPFFRSTTPPPRGRLGCGWTFLSYFFKWKRKRTTENVKRSCLRSTKPKRFEREYENWHFGESFVRL